MSLERLNEPEDALVHLDDSPMEDGWVNQHDKNPKSQDAKFLERKFDQEVTITLPKKASTEIIPSVGLISRAMSIPSGPSVNLSSTSVSEQTATFNTENSRRESEDQQNYLTDDSVFLNDTSQLVSSQVRDKDERKELEGEYEEKTTTEYSAKSDGHGSTNEGIITPEYSAKENETENITMGTKSPEYPALNNGSEVNQNVDDARQTYLTPVETSPSRPNKSDSNDQGILKDPANVSSTAEPPTEVCRSQDLTIMTDPSAFITLCDESEIRDVRFSAKFGKVYKLDFSKIMSLSIVTEYNAWVFSNNKIRFIDLELGKVIKAFTFDKEIDCYRQIHKDAFILSIDNCLFKIECNDDKPFNVKPYLILSNNNVENKKTLLNSFTIRPNGEVYVCLSKYWGCACFGEEVITIQRYGINGNLIKEKKIKQKRRHVFKLVNTLVVNQQGYVCLAGEKYDEPTEHAVVILDPNLRVHYYYDRNSFSQKQIPESLSVDPEGNFVIVQSFYGRDYYSNDEVGTTIVSILDVDGNFVSHPPVWDLARGERVKHFIVKNKIMYGLKTTWLTTESGKVLMYAGNISQ